MSWRAQREHILRGRLNTIGFGVNSKMKPMATILHSDPSLPNPATVFSVADLDNILDTLSEHSLPDAPWMVHITRGNGDTISVGLGRPLVVDADGELLEGVPGPNVTVLSWVAANLDPPYFGPHRLAARAQLRFLCRG